MLRERESFRKTDRRSSPYTEARFSMEQSSTLIKIEKIHLASCWVKEEWSRAGTLVLQAWEREKRQLSFARLTMHMEQEDHHQRFQLMPPSISRCSSWTLRTRRRRNGSTVMKRSWPVLWLWRRAVMRNWKLEMLRVLLMITRRESTLWSMRLWLSQSSYSRL